jgi:membrane-associated HD superfamily phosphohydrolase
VTESEIPLTEHLLESAVWNCPEGEDLGQFLARQFGDMLVSEMHPMMQNIIRRKELSVALSEAHRLAEREALKNEIEQCIANLAGYYTAAALRKNPRLTEEQLDTIVTKKIRKKEGKLLKVLGEILADEAMEALAARADAAARQAVLPFAQTGEDKQ